MPFVSHCPALLPSGTDLSASPSIRKEKKNILLKRRRPGHSPHHALHIIIKDHYRSNSIQQSFRRQSSHLLQAPSELGHSGTSQPTLFSSHFSRSICPSSPRAQGKPPGYSFASQSKELSMAQRRAIQTFLQAVFQALRSPLDEPGCYQHDMIYAIAKGRRNVARTQSTVAGTA